MGVKVLALHHVCSPRVTPREALKQTKPKHFGFVYKSKVCIIAYNMCLMLQHYFDISKSS